MSAEAEGRSRAAWSVREFTTDEGDSRFYLAKLKPFRLGALQRDPDAFGSTYAREIAFGDEDWLSRLRNPLAKTFVAVRPDHSDPSLPSIVGSVTLLGPVPSTTDDDHFAKQSGMAGEAQLPVYHLSGVYTDPASRGLGIGKALVEAAVASATKAEAAVIRVDVYSSNAAGRALYAACGFAQLSNTAPEARAADKDQEGRHTLSMFRLASGSPVGTGKQE
ncbi:hypothetical protein Micbo1qcDRAFT_19224 [Microdochium bolleyi]|uniref:N-acetyltransferase domain-containing protein n=1 Tax=Microdochium bolleyi TaxID=196109 RepID=A0A136ITD0_9PEZI|nr:hypothetical protein Micbo1qcDRAFT_19224 [Microdochium bolleyi]